MIKGDRDRTKMKKRQVRLGHVRRRLLAFQRDLEVDLSNLLDQIDEDLSVTEVELEEYDTRLRADAKADYIVDPFVVLRLARELPQGIIEARLRLGISQTELA